MFSLDHPQKSPLFDYYAPLGGHYRGLLSIPHSGEEIPADFKPYLSGDFQAYKEDVDFKVNELVDIGSLQREGIAVIVAHVHRICVDLNRAESNCLLFWKNNTLEQKIVLKNPETSEQQKLIETFYRPYYEVLKSAIKDLEKRKKSLVSVIDLHSMPSSPTAYHLKQNPNQKKVRPDFCLSDRNGKTCQHDFIQFFQKSLSSTGHQASLNDPYVGGYVTEYVDQFRTNNIQIEINRAVYMDERSKNLIENKVQNLKPFLTDALIQGFVHFDS